MDFETFAHNYIHEFGEEEVDDQQVIDATDVFEDIELTDEQWQHVRTLLDIAHTTGVRQGASNPYCG
jgi:hypothetical protein